MKISFGDLEIDLAARELRRGHTPLTVEPKAFDVLSCLIEHRDRIVSKDELIDAAWGYRTDRRPSTPLRPRRRGVTVTT